MGRHKTWWRWKRNNNRGMIHVFFLIITKRKKKPNFLNIFVWRWWNERKNKWNYFDKSHRQMFVLHSLIWWSLRKEAEKMLNKLRRQTFQFLYNFTIPNAFHFSGCRWWNDTDIASAFHGDATDSVWPSRHQVAAESGANAARRSAKACHESHREVRIEHVLKDGT